METLREYLKTCPGKYPLIETNFKTVLDEDVRTLVPLLLCRIRPTRRNAKSTLELELFNELIDLYYRLIKESLGD